MDFILTQSLYICMFWSSALWDIWDTHVSGDPDYKASFHLTISVVGQRATRKIQRNNYHHRNCGPFLTGKMVLIFTQGTHRNFESR